MWGRIHPVSFCAVTAVLPLQWGWSFLADRFFLLLSSLSERRCFGFFHDGWWMKLVEHQTLIPLAIRSKCFLCLCCNLIPRVSSRINTCLCVADFRLMPTCRSVMLDYHSEFIFTGTTDFMPDDACHTCWFHAVWGGLLPWTCLSCASAVWLCWCVCQRHAVMPSAAPRFPLDCGETVTSGCKLQLNHLNRLVVHGLQHLS